jgi:hypothetical protein
LSDDTFKRSLVNSPALPSLSIFRIIRLTSGLLKFVEFPAARMRQAYELLVEMGPKGLSQQELGKKLGSSKVGFNIAKNVT